MSNTIYLSLLKQNKTLEFEFADREQMLLANLLVSAFRDLEKYKIDFTRSSDAKNYGEFMQSNHTGIQLSGLIRNIAAIDHPEVDLESENIKKFLTPKGLEKAKAGEFRLGPSLELMNDTSLLEQAGIRIVDSTDKTGKAINI
ncbi:MAG: hypothetical protein LBM27_01645 [Lactobacillaceae bacterium]|jgi:hypothetical protein|nr:hypothetical protein [Lactobacillaceae bacterium]